MGILHHAEGVDFIPANIELSGMEVTLVNTMGRETILRQYLDTVRDAYDVVILDCMPSLGMLTINALAAAGRVIIPVQAQYLSVRGLEQLIRTIAKVKRQINPGLSISGILITMADIPAYLFTRGSMGNEAAALLMIGLMLPFFAFGIYEKDGQPLEKVMGNFINASFLRPRACLKNKKYTKHLFKPPFSW